MLQDDDEDFLSLNSKKMIKRIKDGTGAACIRNLQIFTNKKCSTQYQYELFYVWFHVLDIDIEIETLNSFWYMGIYRTVEDLCKVDVNG